MARDAQEHGVEDSTATLVHILNTCGEDDVTETVCLQDLAREVADMPDDDGENEDEAEEDADGKLPSLPVQLDALTLARAVLDSHGLLSEDASKALFKCQRAINVEKTRRMKQTTIDVHFSKK